MSEKQVAIYVSSLFLLLLTIFVGIVIHFVKKKHPETISTLKWWQVLYVVVLTCFRMPIPDYVDGNARIPKGISILILIIFSLLVVTGLTFIVWGLLANWK